MTIGADAAAARNFAQEICKLPFADARHLNVGRLASCVSGLALAVDLDGAQARGDHDLAAVMRFHRSQNVEKLRFEAACFHLLGLQYEAVRCESGEAGEVGHFKGASSSSAACASCSTLKSGFILTPGREA